jgi:hypothetical protein
MKILPNSFMQVVKVLLGKKMAINHPRKNNDTLAN